MSVPLVFEPAQARKGAVELRAQRGVFAFERSIFALHFFVQTLDRRESYAAFVDAADMLLIGAEAERRCEIFRDRTHVTAFVVIVLVEPCLHRHRHEFVEHAGGVDVGEIFLEGTARCIRPGATDRQRRTIAVAGRGADDDRADDTEQGTVELEIVLPDVALPVLNVCAVSIGSYNAKHSLKMPRMISAPSSIESPLSGSDARFMPRNALVALRWDKRLIQL